MQEIVSGTNNFYIPYNEEILSYEDDSNIGLRQLAMVGVKSISPMKIGIIKGVRFLPRNISTALYIFVLIRLQLFSLFTPPLMIDINGIYSKKGGNKMKALNVILDKGLYISGVDCIFMILLAVLIVLWVITDLVGRRERKKAYEAELIHRGWLNHEEWASEQISRYRQSTHDWNGIPLEIAKSERGEYLWTIPYIDRNPGEEK